MCLGVLPLGLVWGNWLCSQWGQSSLRTYAKHDLFLNTEQCCAAGQIRIPVITLCSADRSSTGTSYPCLEHVHSIQTLCKIFGEDKLFLVGTLHWGQYKVTPYILCYLLHYLDISFSYPCLLLPQNINVV
jgi:hypothetical protein